MSLPPYYFLQQNATTFDQEEECAQDLRKYMAVANAIEGNNNNNNEHQHLVQYSKSPNNIIFSIINERNVQWPKGDESKKQNQVLINDGTNVQKDGIAFYKHNSMDHMQNELAKIRDTLFHLTLDGTTTVADDMTYFCWLLVQYSSNTKNLIYAIIKYSETILKQCPPYKDIMTTIVDGGQSYQAIIIRKSLDVNLLKAELETIKKTVIGWHYPLPDPNGIDAIDPEQYKESIQFQLEVKRTLDDMESRMENEALRINLTFEAINNMRLRLQQRLFNATQQSLEFDASSTSEFSV